MLSSTFLLAFQVVVLKHVSTPKFWKYSLFIQCYMIRPSETPRLFCPNLYNSQSTSLRTALNYSHHPSWVHMSFCTLVINDLGFYPNTSVSAWENVPWNTRTHAFAYPHKPHKGHFKTPFSFVSMSRTLFCLSCYSTGQLSIQSTSTNIQPNKITYSFSSTTKQKAQFPATLPTHATTKKMTPCHECIET
jgi:hypothetical protein